MFEYVDRRWGWVEDFQKKTFLKKLNSSQVRIVEVGEKPIGLVMVVESPSELLLQNIFILSNYQSKGIGSEILKNMMSYAGDNSLNFKLSVFKENPAVGLYKKLGLQIWHEDRNKYYFHSGLINQ